MTDPVTTALIGRSKEPAGIGRTLVVALTAHVAVIAAIILVPASWRLRADRDDTRMVMTISLGGAPGPRAGGMTPMGGRPIQQVVETPRPQPVRPPAVKSPEMTMPVPGAKPAARPQTAVKSAPDEAKGRTPTKGPETRAGSAVAETGARGVGFGLSTGGGGTGGYLEVGNFCCPEYLGTMLDLIQRNWNSQQEVSGAAMVKFTIQRDGRLTEVALERSSGYAALDLAAQRALLTTRQLPPLPAAFTEDHLTVHLNFQYQR